MECVFCKIIKKEIPAQIVFEDEDVLAFHDIHPLTPTHILVIPKKHVESIDKLAEEDVYLAGRLILAAKKIAENSKSCRGGYKLLFRVGKDGGQEVGHIHLHLLGGGKLYEEIRAE